MIGHPAAVGRAELAAAIVLLGATIALLTLAARRLDATVDRERELRAGKLREITALEDRIHELERNRVFVGEPDGPPAEATVVE